MKAKSCFSTVLDPYRAGIEIAEELVAFHPEVIFLFSTIHYEGSPELLEAIYDVLESDEIILIGNTGDGIYERSQVAGAGVSALALNTDGAVKWHLSYEPGLGVAPHDTTKRCINRINEACTSAGPTLYFLAADFRTDSSEILMALQETTKAPVVGGLAGDDYSMKRCFVYANKKVLTDSIAILAMDGPLAYDIRIAHDLQPMGRSGEITESDGTTVCKIDNIPVMNFMEQEIGKPLDIVDEGSLTFKIMEHLNDGEYRICSLLLPDEKEYSQKISTLRYRRSYRDVPPSRLLPDFLHSGSLGL